ncbi:DegQ family serine endoprotease [Hahella sp. CR1]|uniref:DegQ family serine endoprotease n=1 Tax=unclassified Hahella TaxID=2624107 RepID=UPI002441BE6A|nr:DegQ family serine endoprotease [Hahella sp. CR1]MDG9671560.1 DegQ family serine endoprotease [Hahella sp. CR1]
MKVCQKYTAVLLVWMSAVISMRAGAVDLPDFTGLVEKTSPAVVNISTVRKVGDDSAQYYFGGPEQDQIPEFFRHFFGDPYRRRGPQEAQSMGSGFIVSKDGYILTNNHVVAGADEIFVRLMDRRELTAKLIGSDEKSDLAVLKVEADDLPVLKLGKSSELKVGEWVVAIGSPFGFEYTVTAGIVSAKGRSLPNESYVPFIQTDVAINPGNSGGPLFNLEGEVVGINSQIYTRSGGFMGVSFAIPIDVALDVMNQLKDTGAVKRGWLGVLIQEVNKDLAESFNLNKPRGALVAQVMKGSPADKAGLQPGDVIVSYNGNEIGLSSELPHLVGRTTPGVKATMKVVRRGDEMDVDVEIGQLPADDNGVASVPAGQTAPQNNALNLQVRDLTDEEKESMQVSRGVMVAQVFPGPAATAGIQPNDVISSINNKDVESVAQFHEVVEKLPVGKSLPVLIIRQGNPAFIVLKLNNK